MSENKTVKRRLAPVMVKKGRKTCGVRVVMISESSLRMSGSCPITQAMKEQMRSGSRRTAWFVISAVYSARQ